jgi:CRP-like cAMP-binding protein
LDPAATDELYRFVPYVQERAYLDGELIFEQGKVPDRLCLILEGEVRCRYRPEEGGVQELDRLETWDTFGRTSLKVGDYDDMSVEALGEVRLLTLYFREIIRIYQKSEILREELDGPLQPDEVVERLKDTEMFEDFDTDRGVLELYRVAELAHEQVYGNGEWLFQQGEVSDRLLLILEGRVRLTQVDAQGLSQHVGWLEPGDVAGSTGLLVGDFHDVLATAEGHARVLYFLREEFAELLDERAYLRRHLNIPERIEERRTSRDFDWLRPDEWTVFIVQRHWSRLLRQITAPVLFLVLLSPIFWVLLAAEGTVATVLLVIVALIIVLLVLVVGWQYLNWRDDYFVLTTQRVVHIERVWPFEGEYEETALDNVEDIYQVHPGLAANLLDYGNLVLQTAGETIEVNMDYVAHPGRLRDIISQQISRSQARDLLRSRGQIRDMLAQRLQVEVAPTPPQPEEPPTEPQRRPFFMTLVFSWVLQYLFPPSWIEADEGGTIIWRRYWLLGFLRYMAVFFPWLGLAVGGVFLLIPLMGNEVFMPLLIIWLLVEVSLLGVMLWLIEDWRNDYFQLTRSHIVLVERTPLLLRESRRETRLDRIQNLGFQVPNLLGRVLNAGHVYFETAGREGQFVLRWVRDPSLVQATISDRQHDFAERKKSVDAARRRDELLSWFSAYDNLRKEFEGS